MAVQSLLLLIVLLTSCQSMDKSDSKSGLTTTKVATNDEKQVVDALAFLNAWVKNCNKENDKVPRDIWVNSNNMTTKYFKSELKKMVAEAHKIDPEMGMDFDPILNAQDFPEKGFELDSYDSKNNYLTAKGIGEPEFKVTVKMINENGRWLVDGCGVINIPKSRIADTK